MAQGTLPGFISALRAGLRPVALRNVLRASRAHPSFPFSYISGVIDSLLDFSIFLFFGLHLKGKVCNSRNGVVC